MTDWQPIETAPKGEWVAVTIKGMSRGYYAVAGQIDDRWFINLTGGGYESSTKNFGKPTHWKPLPNPPGKE